MAGDNQCLLTGGEWPTPSHSGCVGWAQLHSAHSTWSGAPVRAEAQVLIFLILKDLRAVSRPDCI